MIEGTIRPLALCIVKHGDRLMVMDGYDSKKDQVFYRILGGGIEFGEHGEEALRREFQEELATDLENITFLTTMENIFTFNGKKGHEIVMVFQADLVNKDICDKESVPILDSKGGHKACWQKISDFKQGKLILYPNGVSSFL